MTAHFKRGKFASGCRNSLTAQLPGKRIMTNGKKKKQNIELILKVPDPVRG